MDSASPWATPKREFSSWPTPMPASPGSVSSVPSVSSPPRLVLVLVVVLVLDPRNQIGRKGLRAQEQEQEQEGGQENEARTRTRTIA